MYIFVFIYVYLYICIFVFIVGLTGFTKEVHTITFTLSFGKLETEWQTVLPKVMQSKSMTARYETRNPATLISSSLYRS